MRRKGSTHLNIRGAGGRRPVVTLLAAASAAVVLAAALGPVAGAQQGGLSDVGEGVHQPAIDALATRGVFEGTLCGDGVFCPGDAIKRSDMAVWLIRALGDEELPAAGSTRFADVDASEWRARYMERLADLEITLGCQSEPLSFCPEEPVSRGQMASFLVRAFNLPSADSGWFADTSGSVHEADIDALAIAGITHGCSEDGYCPKRSVTRAEMATFLARALEKRILDIAVGSNHWCYLLGLGSITCWGSNSTGQRDAPEGLFSAVASGGWHSCGLRTDGSVTCWGYDDDAQATGAPSAPEVTFSAVALGGWHSCGLRVHADANLNGTVLCWGTNVHGQSDVPDGTFTSITAGMAHTCGLRTNGFLVCWGAEGDGTVYPPVRGYPVRTRFTAVSIGDDHGCGLRPDGTVTCWGSNFFGQTDAPRGTFIQLSAGPYHTCGLRPDGTVTCWGSDLYGETDAPEGSFVALSSGGSAWSNSYGITCAVHSDRLYYQCWGEFVGGSYPPRGRLTPG